ncbi:hypothetical protein SOASR032_11680 [Pragia fontium]|nr:hypothetical protein SOASR032_11680 [Pragia fontium]
MLPIAEESAPMNVIMVNPAMFATPAETAEQNAPATEAKSEPEVVEPIPDSVPEPIPEPKPIEIEKPKPKPKPEPKPVPQPKPQPKKERKKEPKKQPKKEAVQQSNVDKPATSTAVSPNTAPVASGPTSSTLGAAPSSGSKVLKQVEPSYPKQAFDRRIEGQVEIMFDINDDGRVENVRILSANPPRMFERDIKAALKKWRYTPVVVKDKKMTIVFKIDGGAQIR